MISFKQFVLEHWTDSRGQSITGWVTNKGTFIQVVGCHGCGKYVKQMDPKLTRDPERLRKLHQQGNCRV